MSTALGAELALEPAKGAASSGPTRATTRAELAIDGAPIAAVSVAICVASHALVPMTALVIAVWLARLAAWSRLGAPGRHGLAAELAFCALATGVGALNDWRSVDVHRIYDYAVPTDLEGLSSLPLWMLLYWGLILRFLATLSLSEALGADPSPRDLVRVGALVASRPWIKVLAQLVLVVATRQAIYRWYLEPVLSWLPFLVAGAVHLALFGWDRRDRALVALALVVGPMVEILYIQVGGLHRYHLGWVAGVPLWIVLWWAVSLLIWRDLAPRLLAALAKLERAVSGRAARPDRGSRSSRPPGSRS